MNYTIQILDDSDIIKETDYMRPINESMNDFGNSYINEKSCYGGCILNHFKWVQVKYILGPVWFGRPIKDLYEGVNHPRYEFVRGQVPIKHTLKYKFVKGSKEWYTPTR